jgi:hypothetical protein
MVIAILESLTRAGTPVILDGNFDTAGMLSRFMAS